MRSTRKIHVQSGEDIEDPVMSESSRSFLSRTPFKVLLGIGILLVVTISIVVPIVVIKSSNRRTLDTTMINMIDELSTDYIITETITIMTTVTSTAASGATSGDLLTTVSSGDISSTIDETITTPEMTGTSTMITRTTMMFPPNLLENPGGELGTLANWTQTGSSPAILDSGGVLNSNYNPHSGSYCFAGGYGPGTPSKLTQNVKLLGGVQGFTESELNANFLRAYVLFYYQTWDTLLMVHDDVEVSVTFRPNSSAVLSTVSSGALACKLFKPGWCNYTNVFPLPRRTRSIDYTMIFIRKGAVIGNHIDSYIDDNLLRII